MPTNRMEWLEDMLRWMDYSNSFYSTVCVLFWKERNKLADLAEREENEETEVFIV